MMYLRLLILCLILTQVIGKPGENNKKSIDLYIRKKRVISLTGETPVSLVEAPYVVGLVKRGVTFCGGVILTTFFILTVAHCVDSNEIFGILSNSSRTAHGNFHFVKEKIIHEQYRPSNKLNDIALLRIDPPINFHNSLNRDIKLYERYLPPLRMGNVFSWGCYRRNGDQRQYPEILHAITVPIISLNVCRDVYKRTFPINEKYICTHYSRRRRRCDDGDSGAPLVVDNQLVGILTWADESRNSKSPDVFMSMLYPRYRSWIYDHILHP